MDILTPDPTSVYRYYDKAGLLLYVGITRRGGQRNREHNGTKEWWPFVSRQDVTHYPNRPAALAAEKALIQKFHPPFNKQHNPDHEAMRTLYLLQSALPAGRPLHGSTDGLSQKARSTLTLLEHRLPLRRHEVKGDRVIYVTQRRHFALARELEWKPGAIMRNPKKVAVLAGVQTNAAAQVRFFLFSRTDQGAAMPNQAILKLRADQHPIRARVYEAVAA